jgi:CheY-like chemotaxis protein
MKILIVDDYNKKVDNIRDTIKSAYGGRAMKIDISDNIHSASRKVADNKYDLVVLDINIPITKGKKPQKDGGIRLLENIRRDKRLNRPNRLVGLTGYSDCFMQYVDEFKKDDYHLIKYSNASTDWQRPLGNIINQISDLSLETPKVPINRDSIDIIIMFIIIGIIICSIFMPISYSPTQRTMLFFVSSLLLAILFGKNAQTKFKLKLPGLLFSTAGAAGLAMGCIFLLHHLSSPNIAIGIYEVFNEKGEKVTINNKDIQIPVGINAKTPEIFTKNNSLIVIFPKGHEKISVEIKNYSGDIKYTVNNKQKLTLGKDLIEIK